MAPRSTDQQSVSPGRLFGIIPELDGLRGCAILAVMLVHFSEFIPRASKLEYVALKVLTPMWCGVPLFFVLSGFLITGILLDTKQNAGYFSRFYTRRFLRIFPVYYLLLAMSCCWFAYTGYRLSGPDLISYLLYFYNWRAAMEAGHRGLMQVWSLSIEEQFYLVWPLLVFLLSKRYLKRVCIALIAASILFRAGCFWTGFPRYAYFATFSHMDALALGAIAAMIARGRELNWSLRWSNRAIATGVAVAFSAGLVAKGFEPNKPAFLTIGLSGMCLLFFGLVLKASLLSRSSHRLARVLRNPTLSWLGKYSYGIYLFHVPIKVAFESYFPSHLATLSFGLRIPAEFLLIVFAIITASAVGFASYELFEKRFLRLKPAYAQSADDPHRSPVTLRVRYQGEG